MADFQHNTIPFDVRSINLSKPVDKLAGNEYRFLENTRPYGPGRCQGRQGIDLVSASGTTANAVHSIFSFDDPIPSPTQFPGSFFPRVRLIGSGTGLLGARDSVNPTAFQDIVGASNPGGQTTFSGNPLSFVVANSDQTPRPWAFIADSAAIRKVSSALITWPWGIAAPNFAPTIAIGAADANGPDIGTSPNPYIYAFRARTDPQVNTGAVSNLGPAVRLVNGLSPSSAPGAGTPPSDIVITLPQAHPDPQVRWMDIFRWGGSLPLWLYIGTVNNISGATITDTNPDSAIASAEQASLDDNQPFLSVDISRFGYCTITFNGTGLGSTLTINGGGDLLRPYNATGTAPYYPAGTQISVGGLNYTFYSAPDTNASVQLLEDSSPAGAVTTFEMHTPEMVGQPLPCVWGPFGGGLTGIFVFACGDPNNGGGLYWTKGNNPESHPGANVLNITSNSEPLMNGCLYNGNSYVFSTKRMFAIYPTLGQTSDFSALEIPNSKGLFARWGLCVTPHGIAFIGKDGIYMTTGGEPVSLTDADLYPLFPQESQNTTSGFPVIDGMNGIDFEPPNFLQPNTMRLAYGDGFLYFTYLDQGGSYRTLVFCFEAAEKGWVSRDTYTPEVTTQYFEVLHSENIAGSWQKMMMGATDGNIYEFANFSDAGSTITGHVRTGSVDFGESRARKLLGDIELDLDSQCDTFDVKAGFDEYSFLSALSTTGTNLHGRHRAIADMNSGSGQYARNLGLDITWTVTNSIPILYNWTPTLVPKPELTALRVTDWTDGGYPGAKFVQGFVLLSVDTLGAARTFNVLSDGGTVQQAFTVTASNEQEIAFSFNTPFVSHLLRVSPTDANFWRLRGIRWIFEISPELALVWDTQETTYDLPGFHHHRDSYVAHESTADITWTITNDGVPTTLTIPNGAGNYVKTYMVLPPMKSKVTAHRLSSTAPFRLYVRDSEVRAKAWGIGGPYVIKMPFGDLTRLDGARI